VTLWRISDHPQLDGAGGLLAAARWHVAGRHVVYCAPNPATALLEVLVHLEIVPGELPDPLTYIEIGVPDSTSVETVAVSTLGPEWRTNPTATGRIGDEWLSSERTSLLRVPSVIVPATWNILINPEHRESAQIRIVRIHRHTIDPRLLR